MVAKVAVAVGRLLVVAGFCLGVDTPGSATVAGRTYGCADVISPSMLVSGQAETTGPDTRTPAERRLEARVDAACRPVDQRAQWSVWGGTGVGVLALLAGWTVLREREHDRSSAVPVARAAG